MISQDSLIVNKDGSVYHLGLRPEQVAKKIIFVGDPERVSKVSQYFDTLEYKIQRREFITHTGYIGKERISVISTGIGTDNIDIVLNELNILWNFDIENRVQKQNPISGLILRLGTTGTLDNSLNVGDLVLSRYAIGMDNLGHFYVSDSTLLEFTNWVKKFNADIPILPYFAHADQNFVHFIEKKLSCKTGITLTAPGFYAPQNRVLYSQKPPLFNFIEHITAFTYDKYTVSNIEMETAGILMLSNYLGHVAASLSVVLAHRKKGLFSANPELDIKNLIEKGIMAIVEYNHN